MSNDDDHDHAADISANDPISTLNGLIQYASGPALPCWFQGTGLGKHKTACVDRLDVEYSSMMKQRTAEACCPACLAYWHLQMARNAFISDRRSR